MSSVKDSLLGAPAEYSDYRAVCKETAIVTVEPPVHKVGHDDVYDGPGAGAGCVSFHNISYQVSSCFGKRKVILDSVRYASKENLLSVLIYKSFLLQNNFLVVFFLKD